MTRALVARPFSRLALIAALALALSGAAIALAPQAHDHDTVSASSRISRAALRDAMRVLWEDHIVWTRMAIVGLVDDVPGTDVAIERLLRNQDDIGDAIKPFYGEAAGEALSALLRDHILGAADLLLAAKAGADVTDEAAAWAANGDAIGAFLADANPDNWDRAEMQAMMAEHLALTLDEALARIGGRNTGGIDGEYAADVAAYDEIHVQILHMADMLSDGIIAQFPGSFSR